MPYSTVPNDSSWNSGQISKPLGLIVRTLSVSDASLTPWFLVAVYKETKSLPVIGTVRLFTYPHFFSLPSLANPLVQAHGTDNNNLYSGGSLADSLVRFVNHLDPNGKSGNQWPRYSTKARKNFVFGAGSTTVEDDDYRKEVISALNAARIKYPN